MGVAVNSMKHACFIGQLALWIQLQLRLHLACYSSVSLDWWHLPSNGTPPYLLHVGSMQVYDNPVLGMWVHRKRRDFKNKLAPQWQVDKLDSLAFAWKVDQISAKWHHNFHEARRYKACTHCAHFHQLPSCWPQLSSPQMLSVNNEQSKQPWLASAFELHL